MNIMVINKTAGYLWWHNMAVAKRMQSTWYWARKSLWTNRPHLLDLYGSSESTRIDGTATSAFVSWDSKITTVNGILGGVLSLVRTRMQREGVYNEFIQVVRDEYTRVFGKSVKGTNQEFCLPKVKVTDVGLIDFTTCAL